VLEASLLLQYRSGRLYVEVCSGFSGRLP